jgi:hypothetical protein
MESMAKLPQTFKEAPEEELPLKEFEAANDNEVLIPVETLRANSANDNEVIAPAADVEKLEGVKGRLGITKERHAEIPAGEPESVEYTVIESAESEESKGTSDTDASTASPSHATQGAAGGSSTTGGSKIHSSGHGGGSEKKGPLWLKPFKLIGKVVWYGLLTLVAVSMSIAQKISEPVINRAAGKGGGGGGGAKKPAGGGHGGGGGHH